MNTYTIKHSHGHLHSGFATLGDAEAAVQSVYGADCVIGHDGDISHGGESTLCWADAEAAESDEGSRACCKIVVNHDGAALYPVSK